MKNLLALTVLLVLYLSLLGAFKDYMQGKAFAEKLAYAPNPTALRIASCDQKFTVAAGLVFQAMYYFGTLVEKAQNQIMIPPDYEGMTTMIETASKVDPYNMDSYYFAQAILVWDVGQVERANRLLERGLKYRSWDFYLPLFLGFNNAYFLKDYEKAAQYYRLAGELSGAQLFQSLASRYMYESRQTDLAIGYLKVMRETARNDAIKKTFSIRLEALLEIQRIEQALDAYSQQEGRLPDSVGRLVEQGFLLPVPVDPYGGEFFLDDSGRVRTTSKMAFGPGTKKANSSSQ